MHNLGIRGAGLCHFRVQHALHSLCSCDQVQELGWMVSTAAFEAWGLELWVSWMKCLEGAWRTGWPLGTGCVARPEACDCCGVQLRNWSLQSRVQTQLKGGAGTRSHPGTGCPAQRKT